MRGIFFAFFSMILLNLSMPSFVYAQQNNDVTTLDTQAVIRDQLTAFQTRDHERAFSHAAPGIKNIFKNTENFIGMVRRGYAPLYEPETFIFSRSREEDGRIFQEVLVTDKNGKQWQAIYTLEKQADGSWKIAGVAMEPFKGAST